MLMVGAAGILVVVAALAALASPWPFLAPAVLAAPFGLAILYRHPAWGLLALAALVPFEGLFSGSGFSGAKVLGLALIGILFVRLLLRQIPAARLQTGLWRYLYLFMLCVLLSVLYTEHLQASIQNVRELLIGMTFFVMTLLIGRELNLRHLYGLISAGVAVTCVIALFSARHQVGGRAIGLLQDANYFALLIGIAIPGSLLLMLHARQWLVRCFWAGITLVLFMGLVKTDSRSGLLVVMLCLLVGTWHHRDLLKRVEPRHFGFLILGFAIAVPVLAVSLPDSYIERIKSLGVLKGGVSAHEDASLGRRSSYLLVGKKMMLDNPLLGTGPGTFPIHYANSGHAKAYSVGLAEPDLFRRAHNTYLEVFSEMGIPAGILFTLLIGLCLHNFKVARDGFLRLGNRAEADLSTHLALALLCIAIFMLFLSSPNHKYLWMFLALSVVVRQQMTAMQQKKGVRE